MNTTNNNNQMSIIKAEFS